ncbi:tryptophan synthase subunit alpha [Desulfurivibrio alkaliphilus]|uniref:Tryptophan synthase alpha chain n=1 Tax=Desulfurivibrio alkaliphilus (strain DSM 19089 / UNIQEM U267 / AHT2) TaxID=589865 RepID=D6Z3D6_DESAT|nr:tryptophan synthase subunit alpha [Desulfurivibrio alkaliphilus]ADH86061.1 tryptophan synthase, alpha subunit [Desulfurivibrio alkaliphilus AHT 2]
MSLTQQIRQAKADREILLMTHLVLGYPSFAVNREVIARMVAAGVEIIELQIPFSEPVADGPVILRANQEAIDRGVRVRQCLEFAAEMTAEHQIPFLFMTYYNILFKYGVEDFLAQARKVGVRGLIIPDLPPEEGEEYLAACRKHELAPIQIFAPTSSDERMAKLAGHGDGFIYCVARRGVTGAQTSFDREFDDYIARCRRATDLPLAVGFGISNRADVEMLKGKAEIAVIGSATIRLVEEHGPAAVTEFMEGLR